MDVTDEAPDRGDVAARREHVEGHMRSAGDVGRRGPLGAPLDEAEHRSRSSHALHSLGRWSARASAGVVVACLVIGWAVVGAVIGFPRWWETVLYSSASSVTVVMVFAIQHTQHREQLVTQRKLDELLRALPQADDRLIAAESASDDELEALAGLNTADRRLASAQE
jgi:low affinity Fe/Cu permease